MKIEVGKFYKNRRGDIVKVEKELRGDDIWYLIKNMDKEEEYVVTKKGHFTNYGCYRIGAPQDLVEEK